MKRILFTLAGTLLLATIAGLALETASAADAPAEALKAPAAFKSIKDKDARSVALFEEMGKVFTHPRCSNCHPRGDSPRQGMDMHIHQPPIVRGVGGMGAPGMRCSTCHGPDNVPFVTGEGSIPGHPAWRLAPVEQGWVGKSLAQICQQLKDPERSHMTLAELQKHNASDGLVGWGWHPGKGRQPAPGSQKLFGELTQAWIDTGARCPQ